jgi:hypothetical protein
MLIFGTTYWITKSLWFVNVVSIAAAALLIYYACRIMDRKYGVPIPFLVFAAFMMMTPFSFSATLGSGSGLLNTLIIFIALLYINKLSSLKNRIIVVVFLSMANLTRPDNWVSKYLMLFFIFTLKYLPGNRPKFDKYDLLFLIPMGMPIVWHLMDYAVFGDLFYSRKVAQRFVTEYARSNNVFDWHKYPGMVKSSFFNTFYLSSWLSVKTLGLIALCIIGIVTMFIKQRRTLLFMACPFFGTIAFYFVTYVNEMLFMGRFLFYNYIFIFFVLSVGIAQLSSFVLHIPVRYLRNFIRVAVACLIVFLIVHKPFKAKIIDSMIPGFKNRSVTVKKENEAVRAIKNDVNLNGDNCVIFTTLYVACSRISLELRTGRDVYLLERLVGLQKLGVKDFLPDLRNRTAYLAYHGSVGGNIGELIQKIEKEAGKTEAIFDEGGLNICKCFY